nr:MAG TPA: hypothetical protein [Bacteriophage sp.]
MRIIKLNCLVIFIDWDKLHSLLKMAVVGYQ